MLSSISLFNLVSASLFFASRLCRTQRREGERISIEKCSHLVVDSSINCSSQSPFRLDAFHVARRSEGPGRFSWIHEFKLQFHIPGSRHHKFGCRIKSNSHCCFYKNQKPSGHRVKQKGGLLYDKHKFYEYLTGVGPASFELGFLLSTNPGVFGVHLGRWSSPLLRRTVLLTGAPETITFTELRVDFDPD